MSIPALSPLFIGDFEHYRDILVLQGDDDRDGIPGADLIRADSLAMVLDRYRRFQPGNDRRALLSQWSRFYFLRLIVPVVAANLVLGRELPVALDGMELIVGSDGLPEAFRLPHDGAPFTTEPDGPFDRFRELVDHHLEPLINGWHREVKLSRKVLWNNAANYLEWLIGAMAGMGLPEAMLADGRRLVDQAQRTDGSRNPLANPVRYIDRGEGQPPLRQRRQCCIRYRLPGLTLCENCPHIDRPPKGARLPDSLLTE